MLIACVLRVRRKLVLYDDWSQLSIHVALDNMVVTDEIRKIENKITASHTAIV